MALTVYQLKVVLRDVKPAVWRRVLVPQDATIRTLHETVQVVMGWANCHLHQFIIHGKEYGVAYEGGISFADNPDKVRLSDFRFQPHEGFEYVYDLGDNWEHDIRVECLKDRPPVHLVFGVQTPFACAPSTRGQELPKLLQLQLPSEDLKEWYNEFARLSEAGALLFQLQSLHFSSVQTGWLSARI